MSETDKTPEPAPTVAAPTTPKPAAPAASSAPATTSTTTAAKEEPKASKSTKALADARAALPTLTLKQARTFVAQIVWIACVVFALVLAIAVLLIAIKADPQNDLVHFIGKFSAKVDLGFFDLNHPVKDFDEKKRAARDTKTALFNYGICAIVWLVIGRIADRIIKP